MPCIDWPHNVWIHADSLHTTIAIHVNIRWIRARTNQRRDVYRTIGVRANIHLGGQTEFCPNGEHNLFITRPRQGEKNNNERLKCLF